MSKKEELFNKIKNLKSCESMQIPLDEIKLAFKEGLTLCELKSFLFSNDIEKIKGKGEYLLITKKCGGD